MLALALAALVVSLGVSNSVIEDLHRPLHLPKLSPGQRCPLSPALKGTNNQFLNGRGPAYLIGIAHVPRGVIDISQSGRDSLGWRGQKTPWAVDRTYEGPLLIRARRLDRQGAVRFARSYGEHLKELFWDAGVDQGAPPNPGYRLLASETLFRSAGCYGYQVDGLTFSRVVAVRTSATGR